MPTINDYKKKALNDAGYSGDISTAEWKWLKDICYPYVGTIPDMWRYALRQMGFSGSLIEAQSAMLKGLGYTDFSMNNKWYKYWRDTPLEGTTWWEVGSTLDLDFANSRGFNSADRDKTTPDSILTYTSPSPKMVYGDDGVLRYAPHNLLTYSEQFDNAAWTKTGVTVSANAITASDGSLTADRLVEDTGTSGHVATSASHTFVAAPYRVSVEVKAAGRNFALVSMRATEHAVSINLATGATSVATGSPTGISATDKGDGWWKLEFTATPTSGSAAVNVYASTDGVWANRSYLGDGASGIYVWGAQLHLANVHSDTYLPTTSTAVYSLPIDHDPITFEPLGVLIEEQRTNLLTYSEQFDNAAWSKGAITVTANTVASPDGTTTADKIVETAATSTHNVSQTVTIVTATVYTQSVYAKAAERSWVCLEGGSGAGSYSVWFDLSTGTVGTILNTAAGNVSIVALPNGWYRCIVADTTTGVSGVYRHYVCDADNNQSYAGNGTFGIYVWGAQLEAGAFPTSYIPTVASQVTRAADQVSILTSAFAYNAAAGTVAVEAQVPSDVDGAIGNYFWSLSDGTTSNLIHISEVNSVRSQIITAGVLQFDTSVGSEPATGVFIKAALGFEANDVRLARDGTLGTADTVATMPSGITTLRAGLRGDVSSITALNGHIKRLTYFPTRKSDAELQALTA